MTLYGSAVIGAGRSRSLRVAGLVVASAVVVYFTYSRWARHQFIIDDAFISYRYAANLAAGNGLVFNPGERVEGYTNFLWVMLTALALRLGADAHGFAAGLGVASLLVSGVLCAAVAFFGDTSKRLSAALPAVLLLPVFWLVRGLAGISGSGLETAFVGLLMLAMGMLNHLWPPRSRGFCVVACVVPLALVLTRLDAILAVVASALMFLFQSQRAMKSWAGALRACFARFGATALGLLAFLGWELGYYGSILPNTYFAKGAGITPLEMGLRYAVAFLRHSPWVLLLAPIALWAAVVSRRPTRWFARYGLVALALHASYVVKVGGDFMQYRFFWEVTPLFLAVAIAGLVALPSRLFAVLCALATYPLATTEAHLEHQHEMHSLPMMDGYTRSGIRVGKALARLPDDTIIATTLAGTVGYYSGLQLIDEWGLNDRHVAMLPVERVGGRGHIKRAPREYLKERHVNLWMGHPTFFPCSELKPERRAVVFLRIGNGQCVHSVYLTPTPKLTRYLCEARDQVVLHRVKCPGERKARAVD